MLKEVPEEFHVSVLGKEIWPTASTRDLGVEMDALSYDEHVSQFPNVHVVFVKSTMSSTF